MNLDMDLDVDLDRDLDLDKDFYIAVPMRKRRFYFIEKKTGRFLKHPFQKV